MKFAIYFDATLCMILAVAVAVGVAPERIGVGAVLACCGTGFIILANRKRFQ